MDIMVTNTLKPLMGVAVVFHQRFGDGIGGHNAAEGMITLQLTGRTDAGNHGRTGIS